MSPHFSIIVEIKVDVRLLAQTYHRKREESRHQRSEVRDQGSVKQRLRFLNLRTSVYQKGYV